MNFSELQIVRLKQDTIIKPFDCTDEELNDFLFHKAKDYLQEHLATTFVIEDDHSTIAYYSLLNDSLPVTQKYFSSKSAWKRFLQKLVSHRKRHLEYFPAVKIGRLAVNSNIQKSGLGKIIILKIIDYTIKVNQECACKLITVDAYRQSLRFYEKMGFQFLSDADRDKSERLMFLDLTPIIKTREK